MNYILLQEGNLYYICEIIDEKPVKLDNVYVPLLDGKRMLVEQYEFTNKEKAEQRLNELNEKVYQDFLEETEEALNKYFKEQDIKISDADKALSEE